MGIWRDSEKKRIWRLKYYQENKDKIRARAKVRYQANRESIIKRTRRWTLDNPEKARAYNRKNGTIYAQKYRALVDSYKDKPCVDCHIKYPPYVMDFDHVRRVKEFTIAYAVTNRIPHGRLLAEIAKCDLVCANCHRIRTWGRRR